MLLSALFASISTSPKHDTESWVGAEYTPARATNELWWLSYDDYEADVKRELAATQRHLGFKALRVFLHSMVWEADGARLLASIERFLAVADGAGIGIGFVFFDDCCTFREASEPEHCCGLAGLLAVAACSCCSCCCCCCCCCSSSSCSCCCCSCCSCCCVLAPR